MIKNLIAIQNELKVNKTQFNSFGRYSYRNAEDILSAVKPLLLKYNCQLTLSDDVVAVGDRIYIKATVTLTDQDGNTETVTAFAREPDEKKGMDCSQLSGSASSYSRKYALSGIFLLDDNKDADSNEYNLQASDTEVTIDRNFLMKHGNDRITKREADRLTKACLCAGERMSLEKALDACKRNSVNEVTYTQYTALMSQLGAIA